MSGRLTKLAIELGEHDITYRPCTSIKGQALVDFLLEIPDEGKNITQAKKQLEADKPKDGQRWILYTDEAASKEGYGAGLILTIPRGVGGNQLCSSFRLPHFQR
uniref:Uncharacterized protein n=1 Tax=Lactuca sativa TaxID=4236 RepID=A0A9R1VTT5_LACSA|nr:hypothetical protein LSAT_V11C400201440 [Lactuca sativa]